MARNGMRRSRGTICRPQAQLIERIALQKEAMTTTVHQQGSNRTPGRLNPPYGGELIDLIASPKRASVLRGQSREWSSWALTTRQLCDLELLLNGAFSP